VKVWAIEAYGYYGGGLAIIAADTEAEAIAIGATIVDQSWRTDYGKPDEISELLDVTAAGLARVLTHYETGE
jgi:hypothetical protein